MDYIYTIVMGIVQGLTEFLPVSSSGHLTLVQHIFGVDGESNFFVNTFYILYFFCCVRFAVALLLLCCLFCCLICRCFAVYFAVRFAVALLLYLC